MRKVVALGIIAFVCCFPARAIAPVIAIGVATSAGTTSVATASTTAVGLAITALAIAKSVFFPTNISFPTKPASVQAFPSTTFSDNTTQLINTCRLYTMRIDIKGVNTTNPGQWVVGSSVPCNSPSFSQSKYTQQGCTTTNGVFDCTSKWIDHYRLDCISGAGCGLIANGQQSSWSGAQQFEADTFAAQGSVSDSALRIERNGDQYLYRTTDIDVPTSVGGESGFPAMTSNGLASQFSNESQQMSVVTMNPSPLGTTITEYNQTSAETYQRSEIQVDTGGVIRSGSTSSASGTVNPVPVSQPNVAINYSPVTQSNTGTDPGTDPGTGGQTQFPSDYARAGEAAAAAQNVVDGLLSGELLTPEVPDTEMPWFGSTFDGVLPTINTSGATCPVWQFDALGESFYIDHHCQLIVDFNALFYAIFTAFWTLLAFRTVLEA